MWKVEDGAFLGGLELVYCLRSGAGPVRASGQERGRGGRMRVGPLLGRARVGARLLLTLRRRAWGSHRPGERAMWKGEGWCSSTAALLLTRRRRACESQQPKKRERRKGEGWSSSIAYAQKQGLGEPAARREGEEEDSNRRQLR